MSALDALQDCFFPSPNASEFHTLERKQRLKCLYGVTDFKNEKNVQLGYMKTFKPDITCAEMRIIHDTEKVKNSKKTERS